jgi:hypothetical protein
MNTEMKETLAALRRLDPVDAASIHRAQAASGPLMEAILAGERDRAQPPVRAHRRGQGSTRPRGAASRRRRLVPAAIVAALAASATVTAPGQAVAGWVGAQLGIHREVGPYGGRVGGAPKDVQALRDSYRGASPANGQRLVLLAQGDLPQRTHWQLVAYRPRPGSNERGHPICFVVSLPEPGWRGGPGCVTPRGSSLEVDPPGGQVWAGSVPGRSFSFADGLIGAAAAKIVATSAGQRASVKLVTIPADQLARFGIRQPLKFFIARFWGDVADRVSIKAYDRAGRLIATTHAGSGGDAKGS